MNTFIYTATGEQVTEKKYTCKNPTCNENDHMRRLVTSLTPSSAIVSSLNPAKDSIKVRKEFAGNFEDFQDDNNGNPVCVGSIEIDEYVDYTWNFVECRLCRRNYVIEHSYYSGVDEPAKEAFPLF